MPSNTLKKAVLNKTDESAAAALWLRAEGATRIDLARDDRWPPVKTVAAGLAAAATLAAVLATLALL